MISTLLEAIVRLSLRRPGLVCAGALLPALIGAYAFTVPVDLSFAGVMNREHPEVARYFAASERYGLGGVLHLLIEGPEQQLDDAVLEVRLALDDLEFVRSVAAPLPREWLLALAPWVVDPATFHLWLKLAEGPPDADAEATVRASLAELERNRLPAVASGTRLLLVSLDRDTFERALDSEEFPTVREATQRALAQFGAGVRARFAGMTAIITQEQEATLARLRWLVPLSLVLVLMLLVSMERNVLMLGSVALPLLLSVGCTLGLVGFFAGELTLMESIFGILIFGLGVDFAIHLLLRLREERALGRDFGASLESAVHGTGAGIVAAGTTTGGAFLLLTLAPDPVFQRLGLSGGLGLLLCFGFLIVLLPAQWVLIDRYSGGRAEQGRAFALPVVGRLAGLATRAPWRTVAIAGVLLVASATQLPGLRYETNLERVFSRDIEAVATAERIHDLYGVAPSPWIFAAPDLDRARALTRAIEGEPIFERAESLAYLFPDDLAEREARLEAIVPALARRLRDGETEELALHHALLRAHTFGPPRQEALPPSLAERLLGPDGELLIYAFAAEPALDSAVAASERRVAQAIDPDATSMNAIYEALVGTDRPWFPPLFAGVALFVALVLYVDLRSVRRVVLVLAPLLSACLVTAAVLSATGVAFNTVTLVGVPLLLGLGVDDGIHVVHRMLEQPDARPDTILAAVGRAVTMTTLTTCASVATLLWTGHPGLESVAVLLLVGLPLCLLACLTLLPALAVLFRLGLAAR